MFLLLTSPYKSRMTSLSDREVELVVELVVKNDREEMRRYVVETMRNDGYDLLEYTKKPLGDMVFRFRKNREVDWGKYDELENEWYHEQAKAMIEKFPELSLETAISRLRHPYLGFGGEPIRALLLKCTTEIEEEQNVE